MVTGVETGVEPCLTHAVGMEGVKKGQRAHSAQPLLIPSYYQSQMSFFFLKKGQDLQKLASSQGPGTVSSLAS